MTQSTLMVVLGKEEDQVDVGGVNKYMEICGLTKDMALEPNENMGFMWSDKVDNQCFP